MILSLSKAGQRPGQFPAAAVVARGEPGRAVQAARSPSSQPDNLDRATRKITAQGFPTSTSREEGLSTKTNTFHLWLLPVL